MAMRDSGPSGPNSGSGRPLGGQQADGQDEGIHRAARRWARAMAARVLLVVAGGYVHFALIDVLYDGRRDTLLNWVITFPESLVQSLWHRYPSLPTMVPLPILTCLVLYGTLYSYGATWVIRAVRRKWWTPKAGRPRPPA